MDASERRENGETRPLKKMTVMRLFPAIDRLSKDAIYTVRSFSRSPGFTAVAVLSVALARLIRRDRREARA